MEFGTNVHWKYATQRIVDAFVKALNKLHDYRHAVDYENMTIAIYYEMMSHWACNEK